MKRRIVTQALAAACALPALPSWAAPSVAASGGEKVLRYAFQIAETGFDPPQLSDLYSRIITAHIFESMLTYDHLARPFKLKPMLAAEMPEVSADFKTFVFKLRPGILFADDPAFQGKKREVVAEDFIYTLKRLYDPKLKSPSQSTLEDEGIIGLNELREEALKGKPFAYGRPIEGLKALDRYTLRVQLREGRPRHLANAWAASDIYGVVAREVVEAYGDNIMAHPVGTGPFRLASWRRSSQIVLTKNPNYREMVYHAEPNGDDVAGQALVKRFVGRRLPMIDKVEVSIIEQPQPRWLAFLNGEQNFLERLPEEFVDQAVPGGKTAPSLKKRGIVAMQQVQSSVDLTVFNMDDPLVGGYTPEKVALRRAMSLGNDVRREIRIALRGQGTAAQAMVPPLTEGYRADLRTEQGDYDPARAKALLDVYGYVDRDGDGWREQPDGQPLLLHKRAQSDQRSRGLDEQWKKDMDALGLRAVLDIAQWPENLKAARAGKFMLWRVGSIASQPDGQGTLERAYGPAIGKANIARFKLAEFDRIYEKMKGMPTGPERQALFDETARLIAAYVPYRLHQHRIVTDLAYPSVIGYRRPAFWNDWWHYVDVVDGETTSAGANPA